MYLCCGDGHLSCLQYHANGFLVDYWHLQCLSRKPILKSAYVLCMNREAHTSAALVSAQGLTKKRSRVVGAEDDDGLEEDPEEVWMYHWRCVCRNV